MKYAWLKNGMSLCLLTSLAITSQAQEEALVPVEVEVLDGATKRENPHSTIPYETGQQAGPLREERWSDFLPILGAEARAEGYVLPHPFGISLGYMYQTQPFDVHSIAFSIDGSPAIQFGDFLTMENLKVVDENVTLRFDTWVLPFLNFYGILGQSIGQARGDLVTKAFEIPSLCDITSICDDRPTVPPKWQQPTPVPSTSNSIVLDYSGLTLGGGVTVAGGYKDFFGMLDYNYTETDLDVASEDAVAKVLSTRIGWNGRLGGWSGSLWVGAMQQNIRQMLDIQVPGLPFVVEVEQETASPINYLVGGRWNITEEVELLLEGGMGERQQVFSSLSYRF